MRVLSVVGARPQFIKLAPVHKALRGEHIIVHTGQHYDFEMSALHWEQLSLPEPDYHLGVGSGSHIHHLAMILSRLEPILREEDPDWVLVYGDTNTTLAGALAASYTGQRLAHVEAGLRSRRLDMVEERNRILTDHISHMLFAPTERALENLRREGVLGSVHLVGDVMVDAMRMYMGLRDGNEVLDTFGLERRKYYLLTVHRAENVDKRERLERILRAVSRADLPVLFPAHPRTRKRMAEFGLRPSGSIVPVNPVGYVEMLHLIAGARKVLTDSGGVQKEAYVLGVPCITLREETEWVETVEEGWNTLVGADEAEILRALREFEPSGPRKEIFGDGRAAERIASLLEGGA